MSLERAAGNLVPQEPEEKEKTESGPTAPESTEFEVFITDRLLREEISRKLSRKFQEEVLGRGKDQRPEALVDFKASYIKHQLDLAEIITRTQDFFNNDPDGSITDLERKVNLATLPSNESEPILNVLQNYEEQSQDLKQAFGDEPVMNWQRKKEILNRITGQQRWWPNVRTARRGNILMCYVDENDFSELFVGRSTGEVRSAMKQRSRLADGFHRFEKITSSTDHHELEFHLIVVKEKEAVGYYGDDFIYFPRDVVNKMEAHEVQHAVDSTLETVGPKIALDFQSREDLAKHFSAYVTGYLEELRDEALAYAIEGGGRSLAKTGFYSREGDLYFYPHKGQLEPYRQVLGEQKFKEWAAEELWEEKVVQPFRDLSKDIARISARLASTPKGQRRKLAALFGIEPAIKWHRLEQWVDDEDIRTKVGRKLPRLGGGQKSV